MKLYWEENEFAEIGSYSCVLELNEKHRFTIGVHDYTCPFQRDQREKDPIRFDHYHPFAYEVDYCCGYSMHKGFDET